jgi:hypothetical protein
MFQETVVVCSRWVTFEFLACDRSTKLHPFFVNCVQLFCNICCGISPEPDPVRQVDRFGVSRDAPLRPREGDDDENGKPGEGP